MTELPPAQKRPEFRNINAFTDLPTYRLPRRRLGLHPAPHQRRHDVRAAALHHLDVRHLDLFRDFVRKFKAAFNIGMLGPARLVIWKLVALALIWAYLHHFIAGLRHLWMDVSHAAVSKEFGNVRHGHAGREHRC
jgi:succinate dehydrogenase / fumarate reductase cytochrome b subunit